MSKQQQQAQGADAKKAAKTLTGKVVSNKMQKTITVAVERYVPHPVYGKYQRRSTQFLAHDENNESREGDTVAIEESASMLCARVIRGMSSIARKVTPWSASAFAASMAVNGSPKPITVWPRRMLARSPAPLSGFAPGPRTCRMTSACANT